MINTYKCTMKISLMAQVDTSKWIDALLLVLLGIRSNIKEDIGCRSFELVHSTFHILPGYLVDTDTTIATDLIRFASRLLQAVQQFTAIPSREHSNHVQNGRRLLTCKFVFVWVDAVKKRSEEPYQGSYPVIKRTSKHFITNKIWRKKVSI